jgi:hypothetical protein
MAFASVCGLAMHSAFQTILAAEWSSIAGLLSVPVPAGALLALLALLAALALALAPKRNRVYVLDFAVHSPHPR